MPGNPDLTANGSTKNPNPSQAKIGEQGGVACNPSENSPFQKLNLEFVLRQKAQITIDDETRIKTWRDLAKKANQARLTRTQARGLENVVNTAHSLAVIVNYIYNQIPRLRTWREKGWGRELAILYEEIPGQADELLSGKSDQSAFEKALQRQNLILFLARGFTPHFVTYNLFLGSRPNG